MSQRFKKQSGNSRGSGRKGRPLSEKNGPVYEKDSSNSRAFKDAKSYQTRERKASTGKPSNDFPKRANDDRRRSSFQQQQEPVRGKSKSTPQRFKRKEDSFRFKDEPSRGRNSFNRRPSNKARIDESSTSTDQDFRSSPQVEMFSASSRDDLLWGRHSTQGALEAGRPIHRIWCTSELRSAPRFLQLLKEAKSSGVLVEEVTWARLAQLTGGAVHQGIVLQTAATQTLDLSSLIKGCQNLREPPLLVALDGLTDPQNLGAIVRSAEALGAHGMIIPQRRSAGLTGSVAKVAAGALEHLPVARVVNLNRALETLKGVGYRIMGLAEEGDQTLSEIDLQGPLAVVVGSEDKGLSLLTRRHCDQLVRIPLRGVTPSLNASVATAMFLYEVARSGWMKDLQGQSPAPRITRAKCSFPVEDMNI